MNERKTITIGADLLSLEDIVAIARDKAVVTIPDAIYERIDAGRKTFEALIDERKPIYGVSTQFGGDIHRIDAMVDIDDAATRDASFRDRQRSLVAAHHCGVGDAVAPEIVRAAMALRINSLARGLSGVRSAVVRVLADHLNDDRIPVVRRYGSVGASGDLIPLAAIADMLVADGLELESKEGLALINGTSFMTANAALTLCDIRHSFSLMLSVIGMALEALTVIPGAYDDFLHQAKGHDGQIAVASYLRDFWNGSELFDREGIQDVYSLRAVPQGFGPLYENIIRATEWIEREANSVNDNPIVGTDPVAMYHGANFMGYYITEACDLLKIDLAQAGAWIHAILGNLVHPGKNKGLPGNLTATPDRRNGCKALQILAASLAVQMRKLSLPQQAVMLPTEGDNQDVVSLGTHAAIDLADSHALLERLIAILALAGTQALELRGPERAGPRTRAVYALVRSASLYIEDDRPLHEDIERIRELIRMETFAQPILFERK